MNLVMKGPFLILGFVQSRTVLERNHNQSQTLPASNRSRRVSHAWNTMQRWAAATLTAVLALSVLLPYLSLLADSESNLPPCCRRDGSHHCAMRLEMAQSFASQGTAFRTAACRCPFQKALAPVFRIAFIRHPQQRSTPLFCRIRPPTCRQLFPD